MRFELNLVEVFCAVYRHGSFSRAAEELRIPQPTVSAHIRNLEDYLGAAPIFVDPEEHDRTVALTSHLPQLLSTLLASLAHSHDQLRHRTQLMGSGYRSMTRLAASPWSIWSDIIETNRQPLVSLMEELEKETGEARQALADPASESWRALWMALFENANREAIRSSSPSRLDQETE